MSATVTLDATGTLSIHGTAAADRIEVSQSAGAITVDTDNHRQIFSDFRVRQIIISGASASDQILVDRFGLKKNVFVTEPAAGHPVGIVHAPVGGRTHRHGRAHPADVSARQWTTFPIGVWLQPTNTFDNWKSRGINTLIGYESQGGSVSMNSWVAAAASRGFQMIRQPGANPAQDARDPLLLAFMQQDEPDGKAISPTLLARNYAAWKAAAPQVPVYLNLDGSRVLGWQGNVSAATYRAYTATADYLSTDVYPVTGWNRPAALDAPARAAKTLAALSGNKPQFAFIEASDQELPWLPRSVPGPTTDQFRAEIWNAIIGGARGIAYFPQQIGFGFKYDNTTPQIVAEMTKQNARITSIGAALLTTANPAGIAVSAPSPFICTTRVYNGIKYYIVMNNSATSASAVSVRLAGIPMATSVMVVGEARSLAVASGSISDSFGAYDVHIYAAS